MRLTRNKDNHSDSKEKFCEKDSLPLGEFLHGGNFRCSRCKRESENLVLKFAKGCYLGVVILVIS